MPDITTSPNMNLPVPVVGVDSGPDWANNLNSCLSLIDAHDHSSGNGVQVTPSGLNINSDLAMNGNDLTLARSSRYQSQVSLIPASSPDVNCTYVSGVDLYYNDGSGNQVRITQSGGVAGSPGSISNLTSPASAAYVSGNSTFVWQSDALTPANMDAASYIFRNLVASSNGLTLSPPTLSSNYTITLPTLPVSQKFLTLDNTGAMAAPWSVDNSTLSISANQVIVKPNGITNAQIANATLGSAQIAAQGVAQSNLYIRNTGTSVSAGNTAISNSSGAFSTTSSSLVDVTNLSVVITTTGRPLVIMITPVLSPAAESSVRCNGSGNGGLLTIVRGVTTINQCFVGGTNNFNAVLNFIDLPAASTYTYKVQVAVINGGGNSFTMTYMQLVAYEI